MTTYTLQGVGTPQVTDTTGALTVPMPTSTGAPQAGDRICIVAVQRTLSGGYTTDPTSQSYGLSASGTSFNSGTRIWRKDAVGGEGSVTVTPNVNGCIAFAVVLRPSAGTFAGTSEVDAGTEFSSNLTDNTVRTAVINPSTTDLVSFRLSKRTFGSGQTITDATASTNFTNTGADSNRSFSVRSNGASSFMAYVEVRTDGSSSANATTDVALTGASDATSEVHAGIAVTYKAVSVGRNGAAMCMGVGS